jgi:chemotaxis protein methyltransferase CheR
MAAVSDSECVRFLQAVAPRLRLRWAGLRKPRAQVRKRLRRRLDALALPDLAAYRGYLEAHPQEWEHLDGLCRISISRFHRGIRVFEALRQRVLPTVAEAARQAGEPLRCWSAGCASGEEPYTLSMIWALELGASYSDVTLRVLATDASPHMLERARRAEFSAGSLKDLPPAWRAHFESRGEAFVLPAPLRQGVELREADVRGPPPDERFRLILCRYLAFTYFEPALQDKVLRRLLGVLEPGGFLVTAPKEVLPALHGLEPWGDGRLGIYRLGAG